MTAVAPRDVQRKLKELDVRMQQAWDAYVESLRELSGAEYERAEDDSWEELQRELHALDGERDELTRTDLG